MLVYGINYAPELVGIGKYTGELCEWLVTQGYDVKVITAPPYYPYWSVQKPYNGWRYKKESINGVEVYRCPIWVPRKTTWPRRALHLASFGLSSLPVLLMSLRWRPDVLFAIEPTIFSAVLAAITSRFASFKSWLHVQDLELDAALSLHLVSDRTLSRAMLSVERRAMRAFDKVSTISNAMVNRLHKKYVEPSRTTLLLNWVDARKLSPVPSESSLRKEWNISAHKRVVLYSGNLGRKQGLEIIVDVAKDFMQKHPDVLFVVVGDGVARLELLSTARAAALPNVIFKPLQPLDKLGALLAIADVHLVLQRKGAADLVMPSKLSGIWAAGGAVVVTCEPGTEIHNVVGQNDLGLIVEPDSARALTHGLERLLADPALLEKYRSKSRAYVLQNLDKEIVLRGFKEELTALIDPQQRPAVVASHVPADVA
jgi:colanic acid biosynthesis glycosyl transferase WcaI